DSDSTLTTLNKADVLVKFAVPQVLCQLADLVGEVHTEGAVDARTLQVKYFTDDQIIEAGDEFYIAGHRTLYTVTTGVTLDLQTSTGKPISFFPGLEAVAPAAEHGSGITFKKSSLRPTEEDYLIRLVGARTCISKSTSYYTQIKSATDALDVANTAIGEIGALILLATTATTGDIAKGRADEVLGAAAIVLANAEFDKIVVASTGPTVLATSALVSALALVNVVPVAGGATEYMGQAASDVGASQGFLVTGQSYLQEASADLNNAASDLRAASTELDTSGAKAREATANFSNAGSHFNAAATDLRAAGEKANEAISNLRLVGSRLQVAQGGLR
ncbi:hypothetical protein LCGC14_3165640, partial [marine sediment metagenome]